MTKRSPFARIGSRLSAADSVIRIILPYNERCHMRKADSVIRIIYSSNFLGGCHIVMVATLGRSPAALIAAALIAAALIASWGGA